MCSQTARQPLDWPDGFTLGTEGEDCESNWAVFRVEIHLLILEAGVIRGVHHFVAVVLLQHRRVVADALDEQVLVVVVEAVPLRSPCPLEVRYMPGCLHRDTIQLAERVLGSAVLDHRMHRAAPPANDGAWGCAGALLPPGSLPAGIRAMPKILG